MTALSRRVRTVSGALPLSTSLSSRRSVAGSAPLSASLSCRRPVAGSTSLSCRLSVAGSGPLSTSLSCRRSVVGSTPLSTSLSYRRSVAGSAPLSASLSCRRSVVGSASLSCRRSVAGSGPPRRVPFVAIALNDSLSDLSFLLTVLDTFLDIYLRMRKSTGRKQRSVNFYNDKDAAENGNKGVITSTCRLNVLHVD